MPLYIKETDDALVFKVFVQPRSSKNAAVGLHGDALKLKLTAPPVDNAANKMCVTFLAKILGVPKSKIEIISGQTNRNKLIQITWPDSNGLKEKQGLIERIESLVR